MPTRKDGKNWIVEYSCLLNGEHFEQSRKFRIRADAQEFIKSAKAAFKRDERVTKVKFKLNKLDN